MLSPHSSQTDEGVLMRRIATIWAIVMTVCLQTMAGYAQSPSVAPLNPAPTLQMLSESIDEIAKEVSSSNESISEAQKKRLTDLLDRQRQELHSLAEKYKAQGSSITTDQFDDDLAPFFATGADVIEGLKSVHVKTASTESFEGLKYSPDPSYCSNHCYRTCGYNGAGQKLCWFQCYRCCGRGGC